MATVLVTGSAGFIGFSLARKLLNEGHQVVGIDNLNSYYDVKLKQDRLSILQNELPNKNRFIFQKLDLIESGEVHHLIENYEFDYVYHLAAQAGVRYSIQNPDTYFESNVRGTFNLLESLRKKPPKKLILASTSSIYGESSLSRLSEEVEVNPIQFYAATKEIDEIMCNMYSSIYSLDITVFRFFTVYGPWGRPDMSLFKFVRRIINKEPIEIYNNGKHKRSFTYIDDVIYYLMKAIESGLEEKGFQIYNLGNPKSVDLLDFVTIIEKELKIKSTIELLPLQFGDVTGSSPDITKLITKFGKIEFTKVEEGVTKFIDWYKSYNNLLN
jgi:UDP-glucuronate 4-epimerase